MGTTGSKLSIIGVAILVLIMSSFSLHAYLNLYNNLEDKQIVCGVSRQAVQAGLYASATMVGLCGAVILFILFGEFYEWWRYRNQTPEQRKKIDDARKRLADLKQSEIELTKFISSGGQYPDVSKQGGKPDGDLAVKLSKAQQEEQIKRLEAQKAGFERQALESERSLAQAKVGGPSKPSEGARGSLFGGLGARGLGGGISGFEFGRRR